MYVPAWRELRRNSSHCRQHQSTVDTIPPQHLLNVKTKNLNLDMPFCRWYYRIKLNICGIRSLVLEGWIITALNGRQLQRNDCWHQAAPAGLTNPANLHILTLLRSLTQNNAKHQNAKQRKTAPALKKSPSCVLRWNAKRRSPNANTTQTRFRQIALIHLATRTGHN